MKLRRSLAVIFILFFLYLPAGSQAQYSSAQGKKIVVYMTSWCHYCSKTQQFLQSKNIEFEAHDIEKESAALENYKSLGGNGGVPLVQVGDQVIRGYNPAAIEAALKQD